MSASKRSKTLSAAAACLLSAAAVSVSAQTTGPGPYYATPSWDQKLPATTRFIVLSNWDSEAVLDRETGLVWERTPTDVVSTFDFANVQCVIKTTGGRKGWRVPSLWELLTLVDPTQQSPALPVGHPFSNVNYPTFWTNTPFSVGFGASSVWVVGISDGLSGTVGPATARRTWCVRGPGGAIGVSPTIQ
jgi:hypothetical protein